MKVCNIAFAYIAVNTAGRNAFPQALLVIGRIEDNPDIVSARIGSQQHRQSIAGQDGHIDIQQNEVGLELTHQIHNTDPLVMGNDFISLVGQQFLRNIEKHFIIVYHKYFLFYLHAQILLRESLWTFHACGLRY